jgi:hypothetical protein
MSDTRRQAMRDRLTIRRRVVLDPRWISAEHHRDLPEAERPRAPEWIDETAADAETVYWAIEQLAALDDVTADDCAFVRDYLVYALVKMEAGAALTVACLAAIDQLERRAMARDDASSRPAKLITLYPCLTRRTILETAKTAGVPVTTQTFNDVRIAAWPLDLAGFALALTATNLCPSIEEARERIAARIVAEREDVELEIGDLLKQRVLGQKRGRQADAILIDDHVSRYVWKWYPRALELAATVRAFTPVAWDPIDPDDIDPPTIDYAAVMWNKLTAPEGVVYEGPEQQIAFRNERGEQIGNQTVFRPGERLTEAPVIHGRERALFEEKRTKHGPLWRYWLRGLPARLLEANKLAARLTAADEACSIDEITTALAARQEYVTKETGKQRAAHDAQHADTIKAIREIDTRLRDTKDRPAGE